MGWLPGNRWNVQHSSVHFLVGSGNGLNSSGHFDAALAVGYLSTQLDGSLTTLHKSNSTTSVLHTQLPNMSLGRFYSPFFELDNLFDELARARARAVAPVEDAASHLLKPR